MKFPAQGYTMNFAAVEYSKVGERNMDVSLSKLNILYPFLQVSGFKYQCGGQTAKLMTNVGRQKRDDVEGSGCSLVPSGFLLWNPSPVVLVLPIKTHPGLESYGKSPNFNVMGKTLQT